MIFATVIACAIAITASIAGQSQQSANPSAAENKASGAKPPVEVLNYKIAHEYYERSDSWSPTSPMAAENGDIPTLPNENRNRGTLQVRSAVRRRGLDSKVKFKVVIKNNSAKPIKVIEWDFMYPNCENGHIVLRHVRTSKVNVPTGGQKTIMGRLSLGKDLCHGVKVNWDEAWKEERVSIKRVEYMDGSVWQRQ